MYQTGDKVVYGASGVCQVQSIEEMEVGGEKSLYYALTQVYDKGNTHIYAPVEQKKIPIRPIMDKTQAEELIRHLPEVEPFWCENKVEREKFWRETIRSGDTHRWIEMLKGIRRKKEQSMKKGQRPSYFCEGMGRDVEKLLYGELAAALEMEPAEMEHYILEQLETA